MSTFLSPVNMLQHPFEAIIFDCDGTLVDSEPITAAVLIEHVSEFGLTLELQETYDLFVGRDMPMIVEVLTERLQAQQLRTQLPDSFVEDFRQRQALALRNSLRPIKSAEKLLASIKKQYCLASNAPREKIQINLDVTGLKRFFPADLVFSAYDIQCWKPNPDLFLLAAERMKVDPSKCVVIEDSSAGVEAGIAAGMQVIEFDPKAGNAPNQKSSLSDAVPKVGKLNDLIPVLGI